MGLVKSAMATGLAGAAWKRRDEIKAAARRLLDKGTDTKRNRDTADHTTADHTTADHTTADRAPNSPVADVPPR